MLSLSYWGASACSSSSRSGSAGEGEGEGGNGALEASGASTSGSNASAGSAPAGAGTTDGAAGSVAGAEAIAGGGAVNAGAPGGGATPVDQGGSGAITNSGGGAAGALGAGSSGRDFSSNRDAFFGDSRCAAAKLQFCEDFESGTLDPATWKTSGKAPTIDGTQHARGSKALHVTQSKGTSKISTSKVFPAKNGRYWGRAFVYFNALPRHSTAADSLAYSHWTILAATGTSVAGEVRVGGQLMQRYQSAAPLDFWGVGTDNRNQPEGSGDWTNADDDPVGAAKPVVENQWQCIEWMGDYMSDETQFFLDGVEHPSLDTTPQTKHGGTNNPFLLPEFTSIWFGWTEYQPTTQQFELWFDEIAIDPERIGCVL